MKKIYLCAFFLSLSAIIFTNETYAATTTITGTVVPSQAQTEARVREYFKDAPVMIEIARCESKFRQFTDAGNVLRGGGDGGMVGVFQFFESIHATGAKRLGYDITTLEGNLAYAKHIYTQEGTTPWNSAKYCWETPVKQSTISTTDRAMLLKKIETLTKLITLLQKQLELKKLASK